MAEKSRLLLIAALALVVSASAHAQDPMAMHRMHMAAMANDTRQAVAFPPDMRDHTLANMRDHMQALSDILTAMAAGRYGEAAGIASTRLGMDSPAATGCKLDASAQAPQMSMAPDMEQRMAAAMPDGMRKIGLEMHRSASAFAAEALKASKTGQAKPAMVALARVTQQCAACHSGYKLP